MSVNAGDLAKYQDSKVIVQVNLPEPNEAGETLIEIEGKVEAANAIGVLIKPKGRTQVDLLELDTIESIEFAPEKAKDLKQKTIALVVYGKARQHLVDRHGISLSDVNEMSEDAALKYHDELDHADLGHVHGEKDSENAGDSSTEAGAQSEASAAA